MTVARALQIADFAEKRRCDPALPRGVPKAYSALIHHIRRFSGAAEPPVASASKQRPGLRLLPPFVSDTTVEALEQMLEAARAGRVIGIAYAITMPGKRFYVNAAGEFDRDPAYARGAVASLDDELSRRVSDDADASPDFERY